MAKLMKKSPSLKLLPIVGLLVITPLISASLRFKYLYFIVNILVIALGAEAGLFSSFSLQSAAEDQKRTPGGQQQPPPPPPTISEVSPAMREKESAELANAIEEDVAKSDKISSSRIFVEVIKVSESPSTPGSIFFIGGGDESGADDDEEAPVKLEDANEGDQDLFHKAESFIGNFYKQLKMQREHSSNRLSQKAL